MVLACIAMLKAFHYEVATQPRYVVARVADGGEGAPTSDAGPGPRGRGRGRRDVSATLAGLAAASGTPTRARSGDVLIALHDVPHAAVDVDLATGAARIDDARTARDPTSAETFDSPEFRSSQVAQESDPVTSDPDER